MAASIGALEALYIRYLLADLKVSDEEPTSLMMDNSGAIDIAKDYRVNDRTKHIERRHLKIRELVEELVVKAEYVPTADNVADILTKALGRRQFEKLRMIMLNYGQQGVSSTGGDA